MTDLTLRLPSTTFRAVFRLGDKRAADMPFPKRIGAPELGAEWDEDARTTALYVDFPDGGLHAEIAGEGVAYHFHDASGESGDASPWPDADTDELLAWASVLAVEVHSLMPELAHCVAEAAEWHESGYSLFVPETQPAQLDLLEIEIEGQLLTLPWLGSGSVEQDHVDGDNHPVQLLWNPGHVEPDRPIARAWLDPDTDAPKAVALPGVDWAAVGLPEGEVVTWLEGTYLNHHVIEDSYSAIFRSVLERMSGIDTAV